MGLVFLEGKILPVFPCLATKRPATPHGFKDATADSAAIAELWRSHWGPLVGVPTGERSGLDVLDVDRGGEDWLVQYKAMHGLPPTRIHSTRSGGLHIFWRHRPGLRCSAGLIAPGVDVRSTGGYVILWNLAGCAVLSEGPIAPWPAPMLELLHDAEEAKRARYTATNSMGALGATPTFHGPLVARYDVDLPKPLYFKLCDLTPPSRCSGRSRRRARELLKVVVQKPMGECQNDAINWAAFHFRELINAGNIDRTAARSLLIDAAGLSGYIKKDGLDQTIRTIESGLGPEPREGHQGVEEQAE